MNQINFKRSLFILALLVVCAAYALACPGLLPCPIHDGMQGYFTGMRVVDGVPVGVYQCPRGHTFLSRCD